MIDNSLEQIVQHNKPTNQPLVSDDIWNHAVKEPIDSFPLHGGKQIRSSILDIAFRMAGGVNGPPEVLLKAIEWLHAGSLVIDDIEDGSSLRRGVPCLHLQYGLPVALNAGNWMYFQSLEMLSELSAKKHYGNRLLATTIRTVKRCHEGQALDLGTRADTLMQQDIYSTAMTISRLKTGALTALAAWMGAVVAGAEKTTREAITRFGNQVGLCLQMHNDLSELTGFLEGVCASDDLRNARVTWPWAWAAKRLDETDFRSLQSRFAHALRNQHGMPSVAQELLEVSARHGREVLVAKLDKHLRLLAEHVASLELINEMELALAPLKRNFDANA